MTLLVLGIDGLDYRLVKQFTPQLCQKVCTSYYIPDDYCHPILKIPISVTVWASIITGLKPSEHGLTPDLIANNPFKQRELKLSPSVKTIFDIVQPSLALFIPSYNPHSEYWSDKYIQLIAKISEDPLAKIEYLREHYKLFAKQKEILLKQLYSPDARKYKLIFIHFNLIDALCHVFNLFSTTVYYAYRSIETLYILVKPFTDKILIVSDHGFDDINLHSRYGFISYSKEIEINVKEPKDIFYLILKLVES